MAFSKKADKKINKLLKKAGLDADGCVMFTSGDMDVDCEFRESWFLFDGRELSAVYLPKFTGVKTFAGYPHRENYDYPSENELEIEKIPMESIERLFTVDLAAGVLLCGEIDGICRRLAVFSAGAGAGARKFCEGFEILKSGKALPEDFYKEKENPEFCEKCGSPYIDRERRICPKCTDTRSLFFRTMSYFKNYKAAIVLLVLTFLVSAGQIRCCRIFRERSILTTCSGKNLILRAFGALQRAIFSRCLCSCVLPLRR